MTRAPLPIDAYLPAIVDAIGQLRDDPFLDGVGAVVLDEFHERSLHTDVAIALLREVQETVRDDLKLVVMSATLEAEPVAQFLGGCPIVRTEGRTFSIEVRYAATLRGEEEAAAIGAVARVVESAPAPSPGTPGEGWGEGSAQSRQARPRDVLVFLPGAEEIRRVMRGLEPL